MSRVWTCQRVSAGAKCGKRNPAIKRKCQGCGKLKPVTKRPKHMAALDEAYEAYVLLNGGDTCAICGRPPSSKRRLDRDHDHKTGRPRGLLCARCNRALPSWMNAEWLRRAAHYLDRTTA